MQDDEIAARRGNLVLVAQRCRQALDQIKQAVTAGQDMCAVLDIARRPEALGGRVVTLVEQGFKRGEDELDAVLFAGLGHVRAPVLSWFGSLPNQRDLQIGRAVLLGVKTAAVDIAGAPEQQVASEVDEVVLHEIGPFLEREGDKGLSEYALGRVDNPRRVSGRRDLVEEVGKSLHEGRYLVALIGNEV